MEESLKASRLNRSEVSRGVNKKFEDELISPFQTGQDDELAMYNEKERQRKRGIAATQSSHIWEKFTASTRQPLKHYKDFQAEINDKHVPKMPYNADQKSTLIEAQRIIKDRQKIRNEGSLRKESTVEVKEQKKEMFLVSMSYGIIQKEIERLKTKSSDKNQALILSEKQLKSDHENFTKYLEQNKQQKQEAENRADAVMREKKQKEADLKSLNLKLATLKSEKIRMEEQLATYKEHKEFLDKITPKEWNETKDQKRQDLIHRVRKEWVNQKINESIEKDNNKGAKKAPKASKIVLTEKDKQNLQEQFNAKLTKGEVGPIERFEDEYDMFFNDPKQLVTIFENLELKNLFLIQLKQENQQDVEEVNFELKREREDYNSRSKVLREQKALLQKQVDEQVSQIKSLQHKSDDNKMSIKNDHPEIRKIIMDLYSEFSVEINLHDADSKQTLDVLVQVEIFLEKLLSKLQNLPILIVEKHRKLAEKSRKNKQKEIKKAEKQLEQDKKTEKNLLKMIQPSKKKEGRIDMERSAPLIRVVKKQEVKKNTDEEEEKKYFMENYQLL